MTEGRRQLSAQHEIANEEGQRMRNSEQREGEVTQNVEAVHKRHQSVPTTSAGVKWAALAVLPIRQLQREQSMHVGTA